MLDDLFAAKGREPFSQWEWWRKIVAILMFVVAMGVVVWVVPKAVRALPSWGVYILDGFIVVAIVVGFAVERYRKRKWIRLPKQSRVRFSWRTTRQWFDWRLFLRGLACLAVTFIVMIWISPFIGLLMMFALMLVGVFLLIRDQAALEDERRVAHLENLMAYTLEDDLSAPDRRVIGEHDLYLGGRSGVPRLPPGAE